MPPMTDRTAADDLDAAIATAVAGLIILLARFGRGDCRIGDPRHLFSRSRYQLLPLTIPFW